MRKLSIAILFIFIILIPIISQAGMLSGIVGGSSGAASSCDSCTGSLILSWHAEDANIETGTPCGCNYNADKDFTFADSSAVSTTAKGDGTYSYLRSDNGDTATITISSASASQGYVSFWVNTAAVATNIVYILDLIYDGTNHFQIIQTSSNTLSAYYYYGASSSRAASTSALTAGSSYNCSAYYRSSGSPYIHIECDGGITEGNQTNSVSSMDGAPTSLVVGGGTNTTADAYIDMIKVYNVYNP